MLNSESIVIIRIKGEHLLYSKISGGMIGYGWGNISKVSGGKVYYIANIPRGNVYYIVNIPGEGLLYDTGIQSSHVCVHPKPGYGFSRPYVVVFSLCSVSEDER